MTDNSGGEKQDGWNPSSEYQNDDIAQSYDAERFTTYAEKLFDQSEKRSVLAGVKELTSSGTVLDLPCGTGRHAEFLLENGYNVFGGDISAEMLSVAKKKLERFGDGFQTQQHDILKASLADVSFDGAICIRILMHMPLEQQITFLKNVAANSPNGVVFNQTLLTPWHRFRAWLKSFFKTRVPVRYPLTPDDLDVLLQECGLQVVRKEWVLPWLSAAIVITAKAKESA